MRAADDLPDPFYDVIIVDPAMKPVGTIPLSRIMGHARPVVLGEIMDEDFRAIPVDQDEEDVAYAFSQYHLVSAPVVDETGRLVLPAKLRNKIDLENEAFFIAAGDTFQIWKPETYEVEELAKAEEWMDDLPDDFDPMVYLDGVGDA